MEECSRPNAGMWGTCHMGCAWFSAVTMSAFTLDSRSLPQLGLTETPIWPFSGLWPFSLLRDLQEGGAERLLCGWDSFGMKLSLHLFYNLALHPVTEHHEIMLLSDQARIPRSLFLPWS